MKKILALMLISFSFIACEKDDDNDQVESSEIFILNQGSWGGNDSEITYVDEDGVVNQNYFDMMNGTEMGDSGNGILSVDDKLYVLISGSKRIAVLDDEGMLIQNIDLPDFNWPYKFAYSKNRIFVTDLYQNKVGVVNTLSMSVESSTFATGPNPEDISVANGKIYVANSAFDATADALEGARKVYVYDEDTFEKISELEGGPNTRFVYSNGNSVWVGYSNFWDASDVGGVREYNATTLNFISEWKVDLQSSLKMVKGEIYFLNNQGLTKLTPNAHELVFEKESLAESWTNVEYDKFNEEFLIMNARDYQVAGEVIVVKDGEKRISIPAGLVPYAAAFILD